MHCPAVDVGLHWFPTTSFAKGNSQEFLGKFLSTHIESTESLKGMYYICRENYIEKQT